MEKVKQHPLIEIPVSELKAGDYFKTNSKQRRFRYACKVIDWKKGDTEMLIGKRIIIQADCSQITLPTESTILLLSPLNPSNG